MIQRITDLPSLRQRTVDGIRFSAAEAADVDADVSRRMYDEARLWKMSELFWVTEEMAQVALDASGDLPPWSVQQLIPAEMGIIVYAGGLPKLPFTTYSDELATPDAFGRRVPPMVGVDFLAWWRRGDGLSVQYGCFNTRLAIEAPRLYRDFVNLPMVPMVTLNLPNATGTYDLRGEGSGGDDDDMFDVKVNLFSLLASTWALMGQETVSARHQQPIYASKADRRARRAPAVVTTISLRRLRQESTECTTAGRHYTHRFLVRGHWRQQACGPQLSERRPVWIPSYIKGPEGAPLLAREHVTVWRR